MQWISGGVLALVACYLVLLCVALWAMCQPPARFGLIMRHVPGALMGVLPVSCMCYEPAAAI